MIELFGNMANDKVNRYNERLTTGAIIGVLQKQWDDIVPLNVNHDHTKLMGFTKLHSVFIRGTTILTNQSFVPENKAEERYLESTCGKQVVDRLISSHKEPYDRLLSLLGNKLSSPQMYVTDSVAVIDTGIVAKCAPSLWEQRDDDGLIPIKALEIVSPGIYKYGEYLLYAHSYFRRSLSRLNSLNIPFLMRLQEHSGNAKIALDPDLIGLAGTQTEWREYAYWWGPKFNDDLSSIPFGVTCHQNTYYNALTSPIIRTECGWYEQNGIRTFECEEITDVKNISSSNDLYGCRYVHSMQYPGTDAPHHLDGAIRAYDDEKMLIRLECNMDKAERNTTYTKLWRIDGVIETRVWKELITHYYRDNPLVGEYFCEEKYNQRIQEEITDVDSSIPTVTISDFIPTEINAGDGPYLQIAIHEIDDMPNGADIQVKPLLYKIGKQNISAVESETITLIKFLNKKGQSVAFDNKQILFYNDTVNNFPILVCKGSNDAKIALESILELCAAWLKEEYDRVISLTLKVNYETYSISFSVLGHIKDIVNFFDSEIVELFPQNEDELIVWCEKAREKSAPFSMEFNSTKIQNLLNRNGVLHYNRKYVPDEYIEKHDSDSTDGYAELILPKNIADWLAENGTVTATIVCLLENDICNSCGNDYQKCSCIKFIDEKVTDTPSLKGLGLFWTDRMA